MTIWSKQWRRCNARKWRRTDTRECAL